jgi:hypothetical protein
VDHALDLEAEKGFNLLLDSAAVSPYLYSSERRNHSPRALSRAPGAADAPFAGDRAVPLPVLMLARVLARAWVICVWDQAEVRGGQTWKRRLLKAAPLDLQVVRAWTRWFFVQTRRLEWCMRARVRARVW